MNNVMIDLETLSRKKTAAIVSIGAVKFDDSGITDEFYINISPVSCRSSGLNIDLDTIEWWKQQKPEAYAALKSSRETLLDALNKFSSWFGPKSLPTWANAPTFDCIILANAYEVMGLQQPWRYYDECCFRTFNKFFPSSLKRNGVHHNALSDAIFQTECLLNIFSRSK